jgi:hypothetical protein
MIKRIAWTAFAVLVLAVPVAGATAAGAATHHAKPNATPACSSTCFELSSLLLGPTEIQNGYVPGDTGVGAKAGQDVNINTESNSHPNMDSTGAQVGTLGDFCASAFNPGGLLAQDSYVCISYPHFYPVFESNFSPFGGETDLCAGVAAPAHSGENVKLATCGETAGTLWVGDLKNETTSGSRTYFPWVNGASTVFSHQLTLQVDPGTRKPVNQLRVATLNTLTGGVSPDSQEFTITTGVTP